MVKARPTLTSLVAVAAVVTALSAVAATREPTVVFHVNDHVHLNPAQRAAAEAEATHIYEAAGIRVRWMDGCSDSRRRTDGLLHLTIVIVGEAATEQKAAAEGFDSTVAGQAARGTGRAYIFYPRVMFAAVRRGRDIGFVLGMVIAHETGHLLLPENAHSNVGIMRADLNLTSLGTQEFMASQSAAMKARLSTGTSF